MAKVLPFRPKSAKRPKLKLRSQRTGIRLRITADLRRLIDTADDPLRRLTNADD